MPSLAFCVQIVLYGIERYVKLYHIHRIAAFHHNVRNDRIFNVIAFNSYTVFSQDAHPPARLAQRNADLTQDNDTTIITVCQIKYL